jgi:hypothetical protein
MHNARSKPADEYTRTHRRVARRVFIRRHSAIGVCVAMIAVMVLLGRGRAGRTITGPEDREIDPDKPTVAEATSGRTNDRGSG